MKTSLRCVLVLLTVSLVAGCYQVPVTGRRAVNLVDDKDVTKMSVAMFEGRIVEKR